MAFWMPLCIQLVYSALVLVSVVLQAAATGSLAEVLHLSSPETYLAKNLYPKKFKMSQEHQAPRYSYIVRLIVLLPSKEIFQTESLGSTPTADSKKHGISLMRTPKQQNLLLSYQKLSLGL
jgi:hypothetical protein